MRPKNKSGEEQRGRRDRKAERLAISRVSIRDEAAVARLIGEGLSQEGLDELLSRAVRKGGEREEGLEATRLALAAGASAGWRVQGEYPLSFCLARGQWETAAELARAGACAFWGGWDSPLCVAAEGGAPESTLRALAEGGASIDGDRDSKRIPLTAAWAAQRWETMGALLRLGADAQKALDTQTNIARRAWWEDRLPEQGLGLLRSVIEAKAIEPEASGGRRTAPGKPKAL